MSSEAADRGRSASTPAELPKRGWWDILWRVKDQVSRDNVSLIAGGLALYALLAAFPAIGATISMYGLLVTPAEAASHVGVLADIMPDQAATILRKQMQSIASEQGGSLEFGAIFGLLVALWSARKGMAALMTATNIAYNEREERGLIRQVLVSLAFTLGAIIAFIGMAAIAVAVPVTLEALRVPGVLQIVIEALRWVVLWFLVVLGLGVVYRFAPDRDRPKWRWVTWGSAIAASLWLLGSILFALYVRNSGSYNETYGALGGVVILLMWFYLSGFILLIGAEINSEMEHQTRQDTTRGRPRPIGERDAYVADTVGESVDE